MSDHYFWKERMVQNVNSCCIISKFALNNFLTLWKAFKHKLFQFIIHAFGKRHGFREHTIAQHSTYCYINFCSWLTIEPLWLNNNFLVTPLSFQTTYPIFWGMFLQLPLPLFSTSCNILYNHICHKKFSETWISLPICLLCTVKIS